MAIRSLIRSISLLNALYLLFGGIEQFSQYSLFSLQLQKFSFPVYKIAWLLPVSAVITGIGLVLPATRNGALLAALFLLNVYTMGLTIQLNDRYTAPCHCGEPLQQFSIAWHIAGNLAAVALVCIAVGLSGKKEPHPPKADAALLN